MVLEPQVGRTSNGDGTFCDTSGRRPPLKRLDQMSPLVISVCYKSDTADHRQVPSDLVPVPSHSYVHRVHSVYGQRMLIRVTGVFVIAAGAALLLFRTYVRTAVNGSGLRTAATTTVVLLLLVAAFVVLFAHEDPREFVGESATFGTSDIVTYAEAALSLVLTSVALALGWRFSPRCPMSI